MPFVVVTDACVLHPVSLRDALLRLASAELFDVLWSDRILEEMSGSIVRRGYRADTVARMEAQMREAFPEALVPLDAIEQLIPAMTNDPDDRHVLAAAVAGRAEAIVTFNLGHFPDGACADLGIEAVHPDEFLMTLHGIDPLSVESVICAQAADCIDPHLSFEDVLERLDTAGVPEFAATLSR